MWHRKLAGGGVLFDSGAHAFDQIVWWFGTPSAVEYFDDVDGKDGVEANCLVRLRWTSGLEGEIELSRSRLLSNRLTLETEKGLISLGMSGGICTGSAAMLGFRSAVVGAPPFKATGWDRLFKDQLVQFRAYVAGKPADVVTGEEGCLSVELTQCCYGARQRLQQPWTHYSGGQCA